MIFEALGTLAHRLKEKFSYRISKYFNDEKSSHDNPQKYLGGSMRRKLNRLKRKK